jgi:hypothetical protein
LIFRSGSVDIPRQEHAQIVSNYVSRFGTAIADGLSCYEGPMD